MSRISGVVLVIFSAALVTLTNSCDASSIDLFRDASNVNEDNEVEEERRCRFRDIPELYPPGELWRYLTGAACYSFAQPVRLNHMLPVYNRTVEGLMIPYIVFEDRAVYFDYTSETSSAIVRILFSSERFFNMWRECSELAVECCDEHLNSTNVIPTEEYVCPAVWDGWDCWPPARAYETLHRTCPRHSQTPKEVVCVCKLSKS